MKPEHALIGMVRLAPFPGSQPWAGAMSGATPGTAAGRLSIADAPVVGTRVKRGVRARDPVDPERVPTLVESIRR